MQCLPTDIIYDIVSFLDFDDMINMCLIVFNADKTLLLLLQQKHIKAMNNVFDDNLIDDSYVFDYNSLDKLDLDDNFDFDFDSDSDDDFNLYMHDFINLNPNEHIDILDSLLSMGYIDD